MPLNREAKSWLTSKWSLVAVGVLCLLIGASLVKELLRSYRINREIDHLKDEIATLESKNEEFSQFVEYLKTDLYAEEQARIKLGMKAPGESMIILKEGQAGEFVNGENTEQRGIFSEGRISQETETNTAKWWRYFWEPRQT